MNDVRMADKTTGSEASQFASSVNLVRVEVGNALDQASVQLDAYADSSSADNLRAFLEEIQQVRGIFKMIDFRAGERLCEELAETGRSVINQPATQGILSSFTQAIIYLKRYIDFVVEGDVVAPSLLLPTINQIRKQRHEKPLPEAYFFLVNLRPKIAIPSSDPAAIKIPYHRARQLYQLGLIGLIREQGRRGPLQVMLRTINRLEKASRGGPSWVFWHVSVAAFESLAQDSFEMTAQRLSLLGLIDRQVRRIQDSKGAALNEKMPDWLLKELLYLVSLAEPSSDAILAVQMEFHLSSTLREAQLQATRARLHGPDQSAFQSLLEALEDEIQSIKDQIDLIERTDASQDNMDELVESIHRIADTLSMVNLQRASEQATQLAQELLASSPTTLPQQMTRIADQVVAIEQEIRSLGHHDLKRATLVDPVSLSEARIAVISESMTALTLVKRATSAYLDSNGDKMHINNVGKTLVDVAGGLLFLDKESVYSILLELNQFITKRVIDGQTRPTDAQMEAFADAITGVEYFLDSLIGHSASADEAIKLAQESLSHLRS